MAASSSSTHKDEEGDEFTHYYQVLKFQEDVDNQIHVAHVKRVKLLLNHLESKRYNDRGLTNSLLQQDLEEYAEVVDNKAGLNNYAEYVNDLCKNSLKPATECKKWTSSLENCDAIKSTIRELSLHKKTPEEEKADAVILQNFLSRMRKSPLTESKRKLIEVQPAKLNSPPVSSFQAKKAPATSSFNSAKSFCSMVTIRERCNARDQIPVNKRSINEFDYTSSESSEVNQLRTAKSETSKSSEPFSGFRTAKSELNIQNMKKYGKQNVDTYQSRDGGVKRSLGARSRTVNSKFVPPIKSEASERPLSSSEEIEDSQIEDERLKGLDSKMIELIRNEIMDHGNPITWDDISGLEFAKKTIQEIVVWPLLRPDIFTGLRRPPKGILLFGPPGTGKTLIGKCIASQSSSTFFSISASSLTSKWIGESEKLVRTLFAVARCHQPAVIFIDEIDSLLSQRSESEHESSRRIKTEFLVQLDGATTHEDDKILVIGATNRPQELDEAARRRLVKRLYIPLPEFDARRQIVQRLMSTEKNELNDENMNEIAKLTDGYSGADMNNLCKEASLEPIRSIDFRLISSIESQEVRAVTVDDFKSALKVVRSSVSPSDLNQYLEWDKIYGSRGM